MRCTTSSDRNCLECINRGEKEYQTWREEVEQEYCARKNVQQVMMQMMIKDFEEKNTRLGTVRAAQSQLTEASVP